jgi:hypothetical protein
MQLKKLWTAQLAWVIMISGFSCTYDSREDIEPESCNTDQVTLSLSIKPILNSNCISCHSGPVPAGGINLESYSDLQTIVSDGRLLGSINHLPGFEPMPRFGPKLSKCDLMTIEAWVIEGANNN